MLKTTIAGGAVASLFMTLATVPEGRVKVNENATGYGFEMGGSVSHGIIELESGKKLIVPTTLESFEKFADASRANGNRVIAYYDASPLDLLVKDEYIVSDFPHTQP